MANDMKKFVEINEGLAMVMAKKIDDQGNEYTTDNVLALGGYQFIKKNNNGKFVLFDVDPISIDIKRMVVDKTILSDAVLELFE